MEQEEKEHQKEMKELKRKLTCDCGYKAIGTNLRNKQNDMYKHILQHHPERRKFKL